MVFRIASSPYTHNQRQTSRIMLLVLIAALPGIAAQTLVFWLGNAFPDRSGCYHGARRRSHCPQAAQTIGRQSPAGLFRVIDGAFAGGQHPSACALVDGRAGNRIRHYYR